MCGEDSSLLRTWGSQRRGHDEDQNLDCEPETRHRFHPRYNAISIFTFEENNKNRKQQQQQQQQKHGKVAK